jgi:hypothetical protein
MRKLMMITLTLLLVVSLVVIIANGASAQAQAPNITLNPTSGFASVTISGTGFSAWNGITIYWDGAIIPAIVDAGDTTFTAIISVPTQTSPGFHKITAVDEYKTEASAQFRVVDMTGTAGPAGMSVTGMPGEDGMHCWDLNENGMADAAEDVNNDGAVDVLDCQGAPGDAGEAIASDCDCPPGPPGRDGDDGFDGTDGLGISWMGEWSADEDYSTNDTVTYEGNAYISIEASTGENPAEASNAWSLMAVRGEDGEPGEKGEQGAAGGGGSVGTAGFFLGLIALLLIVSGKLKGWIGL